MSYPEHLQSPSSVPPGPDDPSQFQPPQPPTPLLPEEAPRPVHLRLPAAVLFGIGLLAIISGVIKILPGGILTGAALAFWGILLFAFSFIRLPQTAGAEEAPLSGIARVAGIFYEPTRVFKNLRAHPRWLAALIVIGVFSGAYQAAFMQRLTPERIVDYKYEKMEQSPIKPPPDRMAASKDAELQAAKQPIQKVQALVMPFVGIFVVYSIVSALYLLAVLAFGGRINYWQAFCACLYSIVPFVVITKTLSLVILFIKAPEDIHPILGAETLVQDNLGVLLKPAEHPALF